MPTNNLRFVILGDDKASPAFDRFARSINSANKSIDRNNAALARSGKSAGAAQGGILGLTGVITGFSDAMTAGSSKSSLFARALGGINLATGLLEPAMSGLIAGAGGLAAAFAGAGLGLGAYGLVMGNVMATMKKLDTLQKAASTGNKKAVAALNQFVKGLSPAFRAFDKQLNTTKTQYRQWSVSLEGPVLAPLTQGLKLVHPLLQALTPAVKAAGSAIRFLVSELAGDINSGGFAKWVRSMKPAIFTTIVNGGRTVINIIKGIGGILAAFVPVSGKVTGGILHLSQSFAKWGQTLSSHSGFQSLMDMAKNSAPLLVTIFRNLAVILKNVGGNMAGIATPANSRALLQVLVPLTKIFAQLSQNQALVKSVIYFMLLKSSFGQLSGAAGNLKTAYSDTISVFTKTKDAVQAVGRFRDGFRDANAAASEFSGTAGTMGGKLKSGLTGITGWVKGIRNWTLWTKVASAAQKVWNGVQVAFNFIMGMNPIVLVIAGIALLVAAVILAYHKFGWFRDFVNAVWRDIRAWTLDAWHWILGAIQATWNWVKQNWPLLLGIITGPIGLAVVFIVKHWNAILDAAKFLWHALQAGWDILVRVVRAIVAGFVDKILGFFGMILHGAAVMWGWVPGLGDKLKTADRMFQQFRDSVNKTLLGVNDRKVNVQVGFTGVSNKFPLGTHARGGLITGGLPGQDSVPGLLMPGEVVIPTHMVRAGAVDHLRGRLPGFASGGLVGGSGGLTVGASFPPVRVIDKAVLLAIQNLAQYHAKELYAQSGAGPRGMMRYATQYLGTPYVWGGTTPAGWDCSGFTGWVYKHYGYAIPRTSQQQQLWARPSRDVPGALVFFYGTGGNAAHVGLSYGNGKMINASSPSVGTVISGTGGNSGFGIPPNGFDRGGWLPAGVSVAVNRTGRPERVTSPRGEDAMLGRLDAVISRLDSLIGAVDDNTSATVSVAGGGRPGRAATWNAMYGAR